MAFYVTTKSSSRGEMMAGRLNQPKQYHIGDPLKSVFDGSIDSVIHVQADGDELIKCCNILGRQLPQERVYTFCGDNAKEILMNWS